MLDVPMFRHFQLAPSWRIVVSHFQSAYVNIFRNQATAAAQVFAPPLSLPLPAPSHPDPGTSPMTRRRQNGLSLEVSDMSTPISGMRR